MVESLRVRVLGGLAVEGLEDRQLGSLKARRLLKVLALARGGAVSTERLIDVLWEDRPPAKPSDQVSVLVSRLRSVIGGQRLVRSDAGYTLAVDWLDVDELAARVTEATDALAQGRLGAARAAADAAAVLLRGPVLPEEDGEWVEGERAAAQSLAAAARRVAAEAAAAAGDHAAATAAAEQALARDPYDEASLRVLMRSHAAAGRPASALATYVQVRERLVEDLGVSPTPETEALHDAIVMGEAVPDPPGGRAGTAAGAGAVSVSLPGRDAELDALDAVFERVAAGEGAATVAVVGEPGIGKTALVETWCRRVGGRALVLVGRCDALGRDLPLQPVLDAVAAHVAGDADLVGTGSGALATLLGVDPDAGPGGATTVTDPELGRGRLFGELLAVITNLAGDRPVVLAVDDLHLAGPSTLAWLGFAARRLPRLVVVATSREPVPGAGTTIGLGALDVVAAAAVVGADRAAELHARSGGHPLLLTALARSGDGDLPASVREAVERRLGGLGDAAATVRAAAVLGGDVDLDLLAGVLDEPAVDLLQHLEAGAAAGLLVERGAGFSFRHELEREVLDASAGTARRALVHRQAARCLAGRSSPDPLAVAVHARLGGETALAVAWFVRAAEVAMARYDIEAATDHLDAALALDGDSVAYAGRARVRMAAGRFDDAAEDAARAVAAGGGAPALEVAGWVAYYRRRYDEALALADEAVARAEEPAVLVSGLALGSRVAHGTGDVAGAVSRLERAVQEPAPADVRGLAGVWLAQIRTHQGRPGDSLTLLDRALVEPDRLAHPFAPLHGRFVRAMAFGQLGRVSEALAACDDLAAATARAGEIGARMEGPWRNVRAWLLRWTGAPDEADDLNHQAVDMTAPNGSRAEAYYAGLLDLADGRLLAGDHDGVATLLDRLAPIATWYGTMAWHQRHRWRLVQARLALAAGGPDDRDRAAALAAEVAADAAGRGARRYELLATAVAALAGGEPAGDVERLDAVVRDLGTCAVLDGWPTVAALASAFGVDAWRTEAERLAAVVVAGSPNGDAASALTTRLLA